MQAQAFNWQQAITEDQIMANPIQIVVTASDLANAQQAIKDGADLGWLLMGFDMTLERPIVVFQRERTRKSAPDGVQAEQK